MIKILIGGSPCTFWSIAQRSNREVEAKGLGWELFKNYLIAKEKFQPDFSSMKTTKVPRNRSKTRSVASSAWNSCTSTARS